MAGLLDFDLNAAKQNAMYRGLLNAGVGMMAAGAPTTTPGGASWANALGKSLGGFSGGYQDALQANMSDAINAAKMQEMQRQEKLRADREAAFNRMIMPDTSAALANGAGPTIANAGILDAQQSAPLPGGISRELAVALGPDAFFKMAAENAAKEAEYRLKGKYDPLIAGATEAAKNPYLLARKQGESDIEYANRVRTEGALNPILAQRAGQEAMQRQGAEAAYAGTIAERKARGEAAGLLGGVSINGTVMPAGAARPFLAEFGKTLAGTAPVAVDGRTVTASQAEAEAKKGQAGRNVLSILNEIEPLDETGKPIPGKSLLEQSTGSGVGSLVDWGARQVGVVTPGARAIAQLKPYEAMLISSMPRMEGPQSDRDVQLYREAAGQVADSTVPVEMRRAALSSLRALNAKYAPASDGYRVIR